MKLACRLAETALARAAVESADPPARLRRHLERCETCRAAWSDLRRLSGALPGALAGPDTSEGFVAGVWERIGAREPGTFGDRTQRGRARPAWAWATAVVVVAAVGLVARTTLVAPAAGPRVRDPRRWVTPPAPVGARRTAASPDAVRRDASPTRAEVPDADSAARKPAAAKSALERDSAARRAMIRRLLRPRRVLANRPRPAAAGQRGSSAATATATQATGWLAWAQYYEYRSYHASAAYAYRQLWNEQRDPTTAYAAGRTSEAAGDIAGAVEFYAVLLSNGQAGR